MTGHIFDANTLRNLALVDQLDVLPLVCSGTLYRSGVVKDELKRGPPAFERSHHEALRRGHPERSAQLNRFRGLDTALSALQVREVRLTTNAAHQEALKFFVCCQDTEGMDPGEAESLALAATRGWSFYTDDLQAKRATDRFNADQFGCPPYGSDLALHRPVAVHSTVWLLLEAVQCGVRSLADAELAFSQMRDVWDRHPQQTLSQLRQRGSSAYW